MTKYVALIVIGNEILDGLVLDTNTQWITNRIKPLGFFMKERLIVRDEISEIAKAIKRAVEDDCNIIITSGGLGPTHDDITLEGVAKAFNLSMELNVDGELIVQRQYEDLYRKGIIESADLTASRRKMAILPKGAKPLDNRVGAAPGVLLENGSITIICLPGVPHEFMWIFDNQLMPIFSRQIEGVYYEESFSLPLRDESTLAPLIDETMKVVPGVWVKSLVKPYGEHGIRFWVSARGVDKDEVEKRVHSASETLKQITKKL